MTIVSHMVIAPMLVMVPYVASAHPVVMMIVVMMQAMLVPVSIGWRIEHEQRYDRRNQRRA